MKTCKCTNFGMCEKADSSELIKIEENQPLICPESGCGAQLILVQQGLNPEKKKILMAAAPVAILALLALLWPHSSAQNEETVEPTLVLSDAPTPVSTATPEASSPNQTPPTPPIESGEFEKIGSVYFNQDESEIDVEGVQTMEYIVGRLRSGDFGSDPTILIIGTTSSEGTTEHNTQLADARAKKVATELKEKGFYKVSHTSSPEVGGAERDPDPNNPRNNRRAEIHVKRS